MSYRRLISAVLVLIFLVLSVGISAATDDIGSVIAVRGQASIERDRKVMDAKVKDGILLSDIVATADSSRMKLLFKDDSVLTLGDKSRVVVKEFLLKKEGGDRAVFNLLDGKMRSVVGRKGFEVHTPTAVAAARGTIILFETGEKDGKKYTTIICLEGSLDISHASSSFSGSVTLTAGMMITIFEGEPLGVPVVAPASEIRRLSGDTDISGDEISLPEVMRLEIGGLDIAIDINFIPISNQQPVTTTPVRIDVLFP